MNVPAASSGGGGGSSGGGGEYGIRLIQNPNGSSRGAFVIDGFYMPASLNANQSGGQDVPEQPLEGGYNASARNVLHPESGTLVGAVTRLEIGALRRAYHKQELVTISTPEGTYSECFVEDVNRDHEGGFLDKVDVEVQWKQARIAAVGTTTVKAVTPAGNATESSDNGGSGGQSSFVQSENGGGGGRNKVSGGGGGDDGVPGANIVRDVAVGAITTGSFGFVSKDSAEGVVGWAIGDDGGNGNRGNNRGGN